MSSLKCLSTVLLVAILLQVGISWRQNFKGGKLFPTVSSLKYDRKSLILQSFDSFNGIPEWLVNSCISMGFKTPTPLQQQALPVSLFEMFLPSPILLNMQTF